MTELERKANHAEYMRKYWREHPDKAAAQAERKKLHRLTDPLWAEKDRAKRRAWKAANLERNRENALRWQRDNPERYKATQRVNHLRNREVRIAKASQWKKKDNPARAKVNSTNDAHARRARQLGGDAVSCRERIKAMRARPRFLCVGCGRRFLTKGNLHVDHIVPLSKGGAHSPENLQALCKVCNLRKSSRLDWVPNNWTP